MARAVINLAEHARYAGLDDRCKHIAEILAEFDEDLYIVLLPSNHPMFTQQTPYALVHHPRGRAQRVIRVLMYGQIDERLVADMLTQDGFTSKPLEAWEAFEKAHEISTMKKRQEEAAERKDRLATVFQLLDHNHFAKYADGSYVDPLLREGQQGR